MGGMTTLYSQSLPAPRFSSFLQNSGSLAFFPSDRRSCLEVASFRPARFLFFHPNDVSVHMSTRLFPRLGPPLLGLFLSFSDPRPCAKNIFRLTNSFRNCASISGLGLHAKAWSGRKAPLRRSPGKESERPLIFRSQNFIVPHISATIIFQPFPERFARIASFNTLENSTIF